MKLLNKKTIGISQLPAAVMILVIVGVVGVVGANINDQLKEGESAGSDINVTAGNSSEGIKEIAENLELLGLIIIMGGVITVLLASFGGFLRGGGL